MKNTLLAASLIALTISAASAANVSASDVVTAPVAIEYVAQAAATPVIVTADLQGTVYDIINFGYKYLPDPPWLGLVDVIFG
jgi:opacity protein-like surface antigen